ncbi:MAG: TlpA disulfide reductase family protein [Desulfuromonadales bacterium]
MRGLLLIVVVLVLAGIFLYLGFEKSSLPQFKPGKAVYIGDTAPDFRLEDAAGNQVSLADLRGKVVLVNFWATWCPPCREEMPSMEKLFAAMSGEDFVMLAVNTEANGRDIVPAFLQKTPFSFPILYDDQGVVQQLYGVYRLPESFIIRKDGVIDDKVIGAIDWAHPETIAYFKTLTKG